MTIGTKSLLFGAHQFLLHPLLVAWAWTKLYGFPRDWRLWLCFFVHDVGYWGCGDIDGAEGKEHPWRGADMVRNHTNSIGWHRFALFHSRDQARVFSRQISRLCVADKLAFCLEWKWFYLWRCKMTGELAEYLENAKRMAITQPDKFSPAERDALLDHDAGKWFDTVKRLHLEWVAINKDTATPEPSCVPVGERKGAM
jgi:hypothetical protein